ncbi:MAG: mechanosensitive ion channel [Sphingomonadales bacterium]|nr:mechanosensitive ion channel [Sphingomonadales bacterium]
MTLPEAIGAVMKRLDGFGFDIGNYRISLYRALLILIVVGGMLVVARLGSGFVRKLFRRLTRLDSAQQLLGEKLVTIAVWLLCFFTAIDILGIDLTALAVFSGAFGLAVGFGLQKTFGNLIAGIILLMDRSIKPGDVIAVNDGKNSVVGQVNRIGIRAVSVITRDKKEFLIPNENLMINQVENWSYSSRDIRISVPVSVAYGTDLDLAERLMLDAASGTERILAYPEPVVRLIALGESAMQFELRIWIDDPEDGLGNVRSDLLKAVWHRFQQNGVQVPYPQRDIHIREWPQNGPIANQPQ